MRRFRFRLEQLLLLRQHTEREWELKLARATGICLTLKRRIHEIDELIQGTIACLFRPDTNYAFRISSELYMARLREEQKNRQEELVKREKEREEVQKVYLEHSKKRKVLEKLKEKREAEYYSLMKKEEQKTIDDINNGVYTRKKSRIR
ncbi:MAG: flagellar FliJ family protein [Spirochaetales bacterium]|nr:flagellar FliJ family protein [Spirochaetales bacterium]